MTTTTVLMLDGTWSKPSARSAVAESLRHQVGQISGLQFRYVDYPGKFGPATGLNDMSFAESVQVGVDALTGAVRDDPNPVVVACYSQGATAAMRFARDVLPRRPDLDVRAVAALGNPHQSVHSGRSGIAGPMSIPRPLLSVYAAGDPIADLPLGSPLRSIADLSQWMSIRSPEAQKRWAAEMLATALEQRAQAWWAPWRWADLASAAQYADNYLRGTNHTMDYVRGGHTARLARMIEGVAA